jgi:hypothetical protein
MGIIFEGQKAGATATLERNEKQKTERTKK